MISPAQRKKILRPASGSYGKITAVWQIKRRATALLH
jgi:hypothetical protein